ncbi:MAG: hypothetical protein WC812_00290 [Candidatus Pacearchaeota archaeon]|jgi:hypothetical protein
MNKEKEILELKKSFIVETLKYENMIFLAIFTFGVGYVTKSFIVKDFNNFWILLLIIGIMILLEFVLENWRIKKFNELKKEIEENKIHEEIKLRVKRDKK